ncbi:hypothetical protein CAPTEDRAFT_217349 [Capitella teleta]|uniref:Uncharacterized protein n=1 Tax=Capitella teleta TaxID=283909 RepID=R7VJT8_CAPTE|nr:hypothetical protein CAPTEDRAFT_217349 [Capitella teleta]|eukprot:ELU16180.1 hypothetical protein CAPTEDRAFT_217349 [Capitella teleta]
MSAMEGRADAAAKAKQEPEYTRQLDENAAQEELVGDQDLQERPPEHMRKAAMATMNRKEGALHTLLEVCDLALLTNVERAMEASHAAFPEFEVADRQTSSQHKRGKTVGKRRDQYWGLIERARRWIITARGMLQDQERTQQEEQESDVTQGVSAANLARVNVQGHVEPARFTVISNIEDVENNAVEIINIIQNRLLQNKILALDG